MKIGRLHTAWVVFLSFIYTAHTCLRSVVKNYFGKINRPWVDKTIQTWSDNLLRAIKADYKIINPHHVAPVPGKATILMCNHTSIYDIPLSFKVFPHHSIRMLAKKELSKIPILGQGMLAAEFAFIDRKNIQRAVKDLEYAKNLMESGIVMWIAPEGTRSKDGKLAPFKKGAFITAIQAGATIIPLGIRGAYEMLPTKTWEFNTHQTAELHIGEPIDASLFTLDKKNELIEKVHQTMARLLD